MTSADTSAGIASQNGASADTVILGTKPGVTHRMLLLDAPKRKV